MSYMKILKNIIEIYSSVQLEYPTTKVTVWLKDATVPYLEPRHLILCCYLNFCCILLFFPYTMIFQLGYKLYHYSVQLEYPNVIITVWYKDASFVFLESYHLVLAVLSTVFTIICLFPYTFFSFSWDTESTTIQKENASVKS